MQIGIVTTGDARTARDLEARPLDSLWVGGHLASRNPSPEVMVGLTRLVAATERVTVGTSVLALPLYPPVLVAKQVADLDSASGGRLVLGVGVGGEYPQEFSAVQIPMAERGRRTDEMIPLLRRLWTGAVVSHDGPRYPMRDVQLQPAPAQPGGPPIVVAGRKGPAMERAALMGDGWLPYLYSPRRYAESVSKIQGVARRAGRSLDRFHWCVWVFLNVNPDGNTAREQAAQMMGRTFDQDLRALVDRVAAVGTVPEVGAKVRAFHDAGARHFVFLPVTTASSSSYVLDALFGEIIPELRNHAEEAGTPAE